MAYTKQEAIATNYEEKDESAQLFLQKCNSTLSLGG
jgi:hypothetical protein